jgi:hypothetical protein
MLGGSLRMTTLVVLSGSGSLPTSVAALLAVAPLPASAPSTKTAFSEQDVSPTAYGPPQPDAAPALTPRSAPLDLANSHATLRPQRALSVRSADTRATWLAPWTWYAPPVAAPVAAPIVEEELERRKTRPDDAGCTGAERVRDAAVAGRAASPLPSPPVPENPPASH